MLRVTLEVDAHGRLRGLHAAGHTRWARPGHDIVCAAATCLLRTAAAELSARSDLGCRSGVRPGEISLTVGRVPSDLSAWLRGVTDILTRGLKDLELEYPRSLRLMQHVSDESADTMLVVGGI